MTHDMRAKARVLVCRPIGRLHLIKRQAAEGGRRPLYGGLWSCVADDRGDGGEAARLVGRRALAEDRDDAPADVRRRDRRKRCAGRAEDHLRSEDRGVAVPWIARGDLKILDKEDERKGEEARRMRELYEIGNCVLGG